MKSIGVFSYDTGSRSTSRSEHFWDFYEVALRRYRRSLIRVVGGSIRMSLVIGSVPTPLTWHGAWLRLIEDTMTARGALASALATRTMIERTTTRP